MFSAEFLWQHWFSAQHPILSMLYLASNQEPEWKYKCRANASVPVVLHVWLQRILSPSLPTQGQGKTTKRGGRGGGQRFLQKHGIKKGTQMINVILVHFVFEFLQFNPAFMANTWSPSYLSLEMKDGLEKWLKMKTVTSNNFKWAHLRRIVWKSRCLLERKHYLFVMYYFHSLCRFGNTSR